MNYTLGDFDGITYSEADYHTPGQSGYEGISYNPGDFVTPGTSGLGGAFDTAKDFVMENKMGLVVAAVFIIGVMAIIDKKRA
jgi:hypothetical protein